jgi:hypothetical protein
MCLQDDMVKQVEQDMLSEGYTTFAQPAADEGDGMSGHWSAHHHYQPDNKLWQPEIVFVQTPKPIEFNESTIHVLQTKRKEPAKGTI